MIVNDNPIIFDSSKSKSDKQPYDYQEEAIEDLERYFVVKNKKKSLLQIPTGGGKTYTAVRWLFNSLLHQDYKIVWISHRIDLLEQARNTMIEESGLLKGLSTKTDCYIIGGGYAVGSTLATAKESVIFITSQTLASANGHKAMKAFCKKNKDNKIMFVIDEAHHSVASTIKIFINGTINKFDNFKLLGLTATPTRTVEMEKAILSNLYDNHLISGIGINELIKAGHLAWPKPEKIITAINLEATYTITEETKAYFATRRELDPAFLNAISKNSTRNKLIVDTYLKNRERYGKTLIFAIDIMHARMLKIEFEKKDSLKVDVTYSGIEGHAEIIENFKVGALDVLINVSKLTEGFDDPKIQTVFLTRPTQSEILFSQMIGRGLRGGVKGTKEAYLVSFEDHWEQFTGWLDTEKISSLFALEEEAEEKEEIGLKEKVIFQTVSYEVIDELYKQISSLNNPELSIPTFECWPIGWYTLQFESDTENAEVAVPISRTVIVFSHQKQSWDELCISIANRLPNDQERDTLYNNYFYDLPNPAVSRSIMDLFIDSCYSTGEFILPEFYTLESREEASVDKLANLLYEESLGGKARQEYIEKWYLDFPLLSDIYNSIENFTEAVDYATRRITFPDQYRKTIATGDQYLKVEKLKLNIPATDTQKLVAVFEELKVNKDLFPKGFEYEPVLEWTHRVMKSYFGIAYLNTGKFRIKINCILNSSEIEQNEDLIKFIMYHEMLHFSVSKNHGKEFRHHENKYPDVVNLNSILDRLGLKYDIDSKFI